MKFMKRIPFLGKLMIMGVIPIALLGIVVGALSYHRAEQVVQQSEKQVLADTINRIDININVKARQLDGFVRAVADSAQVEQLITWSRSDGASYDESGLAEFCRNTVGTFSEGTSVNVLLGQDVVYAAGETDGQLDAALLTELYARASQYPGKVQWSNLSKRLRSGAEGQTLLLYEGLRDAAGQTVGLIVLELDARLLGSGMLTKQKILSSQTTFLVDRTGAVIYSDNTLRDAWLQRVLEQYRLGNRKFYVTDAGTPYYVCSQYNALTNWVTFTIIQQSNLFPGAAGLRRYIVILVCVAAGLAFLFLLLLSIAIVKPLETLKTGMKQAQSSNFELQLENDRSDEIGALTDTFNSMVTRINTLVNQVYQEKIAQQNAELEALQAQINPHFLYNTLDSVNWMLIDRNEMDISAVVVALGKLMQYSMDTATAMVTLEQEYQNVRDYLMIQKNRLEERLEFRLELEPGLEHFPVPKLILQPLVENCIKHGIEPSPRPGTVLVRAGREAGGVHILVKDDGRGMTREQLEDYRSLLYTGQNSHTSIGVRNVARRLQLHFGGHCCFEVNSCPGDGVTLELTILDKEAHGCIS